MAGGGVGVTELKPGIRKLVALLHAHGFVTCDSGDGETHDFACDRAHGYVACRTAPAAMAYEADRLAELLSSFGLAVAEPDEKDPPEGVCHVQATYDPVNGIALLDVTHVHDRMLKAGL